MERFKKAFDWVFNFKNYFALKACPNPTILKILRIIAKKKDGSIELIRRAETLDDYFSTLKGINGF